MEAEATTNLADLVGMAAPPAGHCSLCGLPAKEDHGDLRVCVVLLRRSFEFAQMELEIADGTIEWLNNKGR